MQEDNSINNLSQNPSSFNNNMATSTNGIRELHGKPEEDSAIWVRDILLVSRLSRFSEEYTLRSIVLKLRDTALVWDSELVEQREWRICLEKFILLFKRRSSNFYNPEVTLTKILTYPSPATREEFTALLNTGTILFEQNLMITCALTQVMIGKYPII
ncbi:hypothetical protein NGRA_2743 [Nosema granulosis]|uniref:Uncharacterized protein n=1 Tax=Nosema granulosis TaxID=83296 RepID=A0A9P6KXE9_9MICR|nr:hypothetical protein NGRA_2743 [Nosema granulosis]